MLSIESFSEALALTFCFRDPQIERSFQDNHLRKVVKSARLSILIPLFVCFGIIGLYSILYPSVVWSIIISNYIVVIPLLLIAFRLTFLPNSYRFIQSILAAVCVVSAFSIIHLIIQDLDSFPNHDYAISTLLGGLILISLYGYTASQLSLAYAITVGLLIWVSFNTVVFTSLPATHYDFLLFDNFDILIANMIGTFANRSLQFYLRKDFWQSHLLASEKEKSDQLLLNVLPEVIARRLKEKEQTIADSFTEATILFADIVGFTRLSGILSPQELVEMLNQIFSAFDLLVEKHGLEKIKTIGDAYMVVGGLPAHRPDHAEAIADMALDMQKEIDILNHLTQQKFAMRIGINSGEVVAGVIGRRKFIYDLWGDAVNTASRMESHGLPNTIQVTEATYNLLKDKYTLQPRGEIDIKGKGRMLTFLLTGKTPSD